MVPDAEPDAFTQNQITENMEVHHHPNAEKKSLKGYILEGLMIFMAVTMGFIAENIRENVTEHKTAIILAQSLLEDIKKDTTSLHRVIAFSFKKLIAADNTLAILRSPRDQWNDTIFYKNMGPIMTSLPFIPTNGTYEQMKASGSLHYFRQSLVNQMNAYDVQLKSTEYRDNVEDKGIWILGPFNFDIINMEVLTDLLSNKPVTHEMYIKINNKAMVDKIVNLVLMAKLFRARSLSEYQKQLEIADKLIEALNKEYHLD